MSLTLGHLSQPLYDTLTAFPHHDFEIMLAIADALEEEGECDLSVAYRWAAHNKKYPTSIYLRRLGYRVSDWDREQQRRVPEHARLPAHLYVAIRELKDREYGTVNDAFVLLARVSDKLRTLSLGEAQS